jgi:hypothetical protein
MRKSRKNDSPSEKVAILRRHLIDHIPVSDLCDAHQPSPTLFNLWQKPFFENGPAGPGRHQRAGCARAARSPRPISPSRSP